jgi:hypothetical protein
MHNQTSPWATAAGALRRLAPYALAAAFTIALAIFLPNKVDALPISALAFSGIIMDSTLEFCDATALNTGAAGTYLIGNVVDLVKVRDIGNGRQVFLVISVDTAVTSGGAATVQFQLASDAQAAIATDGSATLHWQSAAIPKATLVAGYQIVVPLPSRLPDYEEFLGILQVTGTAAVTAGKVNAFLATEPDQWKAYPNSVNAI